VATDGILIPTGEILDNEPGQAFDFWSEPKQIGEDLEAPAIDGACGSNCTGYDQCFLFKDGGPEAWRDESVATLSSPWSGIQIDIFTNQPAMQLYSCNTMNGVISIIREER